MSLLYRKYSLDVDGGGISRSQIAHTQAEMLVVMLAETAKGHRVTVRERWLEDQGAGPVEGEGRAAVKQAGA